MPEIRFHMQKDRKILRKIAKKGNENGTDDWLCDNFDTVQSVFRSIPHRDSSLVSALTADCMLLCKDGILPEETVLLQNLQRLHPTSRQCDYLPLCLQRALVHRAAQTVSDSENGVAVRADCIRSLLRLREIDFSAHRSFFSETERILESDEAGLYAHMSNETKAAYRRQIEKTAKQQHKTEFETAKQALQRSAEEQSESKKHIGFHLGFQHPDKKYGYIFLSVQLLVAIGLSALLSCFLHRFFAFFLLLFPVWEILQAPGNAVLRHLFPVRQPFSMQPTREIPETGRTVLTVSCLLPRGDDIAEMKEHLEKLVRTNGKGAVWVTVLADLSEENTPVLSRDESDIAAVCRMIDGLNETFGGGFLLAIRSRIYSPTQKKYTGYERKRGALLQFAGVLCGDINSGFSVLYGDKSYIHNTKFIFALDADTQPCFGCLSRLCADALHPLNRPVTDKACTKVIDGYGIFVPASQSGIRSASRTKFAGIMTGGGGFSAYAQGISERNMDMFGESIFTGKGLIDVAVFYRLCAERFPTQRILSHDIPEGGILRTAFDGKAGFTDSFPSKESAYFARLHRWLRGDRQNLRWIWRPLGKAMLPAHTRLLLADNIRRAVTPVFALALLLSSLFFDGKYAVTVQILSLLSACSGELTALLTAVLKQGILSLTRRYFSLSVPGFSGGILRCILLCAMLPECAFCSLDAFLRTSFRLTFSHRRLLEWTTAAHADKNSTVHVLREIVLPSLTGLLLLAKGDIFGVVIGALFLLHVPFSQSDGIPVSAVKSKPTDDETAFLTEEAAAMWHFFAEYVNEENHFLPPDNVQEMPFHSVAHRTSPTNIGLYLCSVLAAADFSFIDARQMYLLIHRTLDTVEKLEKRNGNLLNWYDTKTLSPLPPAYVSTVDSGNFICCLAALREGLREYIIACPSLSAETERIDRLVADTDLQSLYNPGRNLFYVGADAETGKPSSSCYDLLMSESRMTGYFAVSRGDVPPEHWSALGRTQVGLDGYIGTAGWTGTFFEYFMPALFMPVYRNTLLSESLSFCLYAQKKYANRHRIPWGIGESGFHAFDGGRHYAYKAHSVPPLAVKRDADYECVVSPYSTFLALPLFRKEAVANLRRLHTLHAEGRFGLYEAVDFSSQRYKEGEYGVVRSYMAHHVGMSIVACADALSDNGFVRRFMRHPDVSPASDLLYERIPDTPTLFRRSVTAVGKTKITRKKTPSVIPSEVALRTNGEWTMIVDKWGRNENLFAGTRMTAKMPFGSGVAAALLQRGTVVPLASHPDCHFTFSENGIANEVMHGRLKLRFSAVVHPHLPGAYYSVRIDNTGKKKEKASVCLYAQPLLLPLFMKDGHPAFHRLFLHGRYDDDSRIFFFTRKTEDFRLCLAMGLYDRKNFTFSTDRESVLPRGGSAVFPITPDFSRLDYNEDGTDRCLAMHIPIRLSAGAGTRCVLLFAAGTSEKEAEDRLLRMRREDIPPVGRCGKNPFGTDACVQETAEKILAGIFFDAPPPPDVQLARQQNQNGREALWESGISGDLPIVTAVTDGQNEEECLPEFTALQHGFSVSGIPTDFVFVRGINGGYNESADTVLRKYLKKNNASQIGNMYSMQKNTMTPQALHALTVFSEGVFPSVSTQPRSPVFMTEERRDLLTPADTTEGFFPHGYRFSHTPDVPWCLTQANNISGFLVSDKSPGFTWGYNSRLNKLTPWDNDTRSALTGEELCFASEDGVCNIASGMCFYTDNGIFFEGMYHGFHLRTAIRQHRTACIKQISVRIENTDCQQKRTAIGYKIRPVLAEFAEDARFVRYECENGSIYLHNPVNTTVPGTAKLLCSFPGQTVLCETEFNKMLKTLSKMMKTDDIIPDCAGIVCFCDIPAKTTKTFVFRLCFARTKNAADRIGILPFEAKKPVRLALPEGNELLLHTVTDTRMQARCGFYQCGGAWGFRDQLQDSLALLPIFPDLTRRQILRCCAVQFEEGDVLHWHHALFPKNEKTALFRGVRTRCSDDMLWLVFVCSQYVVKTGDISLLDISVPFLSAPPLAEDEKDRYDSFRPSAHTGSVYSHCLRAVGRICRFGSHGLPLIGSGDWNDAMHTVGIRGKGESVWLAMFLSMTAQRFATVCRMKGDMQAADKMTALSDSLKNRIDRAAWDGNHYIRAFFDDGTPMQTLDVLPQAFASLCGMPDKNRVRTALATAYNELFDRDSRTVQLFTPAFTENSVVAGYINEYPPGVRENGGQYTHAVVWLAAALRKEGFYRQADEILQTVSPVDRPKIYRGEPFTPAGDILTCQGRKGQAGWTMYTGSAGWYLTELLHESN